MNVSFANFGPSLPHSRRRGHLRSTTVCMSEKGSSVKNWPGTGPARAPSFAVFPPRSPIEDRPKAAPFHFRVPLIGVLLEHWLGVHVSDLAEKYGPIYRSLYALEVMHFVSDMDAIADIQNAEALFSSVGSFDPSKALFGERSMLLLDGVDHAAVRGMVAPAFSSNVFPFYFDKIRDRVKKTWAQVGRTVNEKGRDLLDPVLRQAYVCVIVELTTGIDMDSDLASFVLSRFAKMPPLFFSPPFGPLWDQGVAARAEIMELLEQLICRNLLENRDTIERLREYGDSLHYKGSQDIKKGAVNVLLIAIAQSDLSTAAGAAPDPATVTQLAEVMILLWFAGYVTSAATTSCAAFELGLDGAIQRWLRAEQDALVLAGGTRDVSYEQVAAQMPRLDAYLTEILRLHPPVAGAVRVATRDLSVLGRRVQKGEKLFLSYTASMRDARAYRDPHALRMDRFVRAGGGPPPRRVNAFGSPRSVHYCLGAALAGVLMKTTLAVLLREYTLELDPAQSRRYAHIPDDTPRSRVVVTGLPRRE